MNRTVSSVSTSYVYIGHVDSEQVEHNKSDTPRTEILTWTSATIDNYR